MRLFVMSNHFKKEKFLSFENTMLRLIRFVFEGFLIPTIVNVVVYRSLFWLLSRSRYDFDKIDGIVVLEFAGTHRNVE